MELGLRESATDENGSHYSVQMTRLGSAEQPWDVSFTCTQRPWHCVCWYGVLCMYLANSRASVSLGCDPPGSQSLQSLMKSAT